MSSNIEAGAPRATEPGWRSTASRTWHEDSRKDPDELEREIDETRAEVQATLHALERKLSPNKLFDQTVGRFRDQGGEFVHNLSEQIRQNPMPVLLTSIGIAWMMVNGRRNNGGMSMPTDSGSGRMRERWDDAKERAAGVKDSLASAGQAIRERGAALRERGATARDKLHGSRERMSGASRAVGERSRRAASMARDEWAHARSTFDHMLEEQPLMLGAIGLAAGAIIGAVLPATEAEDRRLGPMRDRTMERARHTGEQRVEQVREGAEHLTERAKEHLRGAGEPQTQRGEEQRREDLDAPGERGLAGAAGDTLRQPGGAAASGTSTRTDKTPPPL